MEKRTIDYSRTEIVHVVQPQDLNGCGRLFGGVLLQKIDEVAAIVAKRHAQCANVTTAAIDNLNFKSGAFVNDLIVIIGRITFTGNSSMEVRVDTYVENTLGERRVINRAYLVMVALGDNDRAVAVPGILLETEAQKAEWNGAVKRKQLRLVRRDAGY